MAPYSIQVDVFRRLEEIIGKEATGIVVDILQDVKTELQQEIDLVKTELRKDIDLVRTELDNKIELVKTDLGKKIELVKTELQKEIDKLRTEVKKDIKIIGIILIAVVVILNKNPIELLVKILGIIK